MSSLGEAARRALNSVDARTYEYQSDFARHYIALGKSEGRAELITRLLAYRFGQLDAHTQAFIQQASAADLDTIGERLLTARTLREALGDSSSGIPQSR